MGKYSSVLVSLRNMVPCVCIYREREREAQRRVRAKRSVRRCKVSSLHCEHVVCAHQFATNRGLFNKSGSVRVVGTDKKSRSKSLSPNELMEMFSWLRLKTWSQLANSLISLISKVIIESLRV